MGDAVRFADLLRSEVHRASNDFAAAVEAATILCPADGKWCARDILGHLIDSAANNHRRFIVGQSDESATYDQYAQNDWVDRGRYRDADWNELLTLWRAYNLHLARIVGSMSDETLASERMRYLVDDYIRHMRHHLDQIRGLLR